MQKEYRLIIDTEDRAIEIIEPTSLESCWADGESAVAEGVISMLDEAEML